MTILELIDAYAAANRAECNVLEQGTDAELHQAMQEKHDARAAVVAALAELEQPASNVIEKMREMLAMVEQRDPEFRAIGTAIGEAK